MIDLFMLAQAATENAPAGPSFAEVLLSIAAALGALFTWLENRRRAREAEERRQAEAERDATLRGVDRATARMEAPAAKLAREELRQAQAEAGVQPAIDARLNELRTGKGGAS